MTIYEKELLNEIDLNKNRTWTEYGNFIMIYCGSSIAVQSTTSSLKFLNFADYSEITPTLDQCATVTVNAQSFSNIKYVSILDTKNKLIAAANITIKSSSQFTFVVPCLLNPGSYKLVAEKYYDNVDATLFFDI